MPFEKVETQVDFPAQERAILEFWERIGAFEKLRAKNRGKPRWSFLDGPITANNPMGVHHAWGRTYKDAYPALLRHDRPASCAIRTASIARACGSRSRSRRNSSCNRKRDIENLVPGDPFASIDKFVAAVQGARRQVRPRADRAVDPPRLLDGLGPPTRTGQKPPDERRSYFTMSEENNYTIWSFLKKCHDRGLIYRGYDAMPWCPRCARRPQPDGNGTKATSMVAHRAVFVRFPLRGSGPGENLLVWTTTPWTLSSNVGAAVNPELTYLKVKHKDQIYYLAKGAFTAQRLEEQFKTQGMGRRRAQAQDAGADLQGKGRLRDRSARSRAPTWSAGTTTVRSTNCPRSSMPPAIPTRSPVVAKQQLGPGQVGPRCSTASSPGRRRRDRRHRHRPHRPRLRQGRLQPGQGAGPAADRPARRVRRLPAPASAS